MVTIMAFEDTRNVLSSWKSAWRRKTKDESLIVICGMILAAEILKANYKGWGARYPGGFNAASKMLEGHSVQDSTRLMRIFMVGQAVGDPNLARLIDGIFDPNQPWGRQG